jgi:hypothetical protein
VAEAKPFASLSSGLLARKGAARPAMRPQGFGQSGQSLEDLGWDDMGFDPPKPVPAARDATHDAFGDSVIEYPRVHPTGLTPVQSPVHHQREEIANRLSDEEDVEELNETAEVAAEEASELPVVAVLPSAAAVQPVAPVRIAKVPEQASVARRAPRPRSGPAGKAKAAFTLRLDPERHLKLRLACAVDGRSAQQIVTQALDEMLERMPEVDVMAAKAHRKG